MADGTVSRFIWLRQFEVGKNSAGASHLLDRLEFLQGMELAPDILDGLPPHRVTQLRRQGERYFAPSRACEDALPGSGWPARHC
jgi:hypothetical protein